MDNKLESYITKLLLFCYLIKHLSNYIFDNKCINLYIYLEGKKEWRMPQYSTLSDLSSHAWKAALASSGSISSITFLRFFRSKASSS